MGHAIRIPSMLPTGASTDYLQKKGLVKRLFGDLLLPTCRTFQVLCDVCARDIAVDGGGPSTVGVFAG